MTPRVIKSTRVDGIETELVDKPKHDGFGFFVVARHRKRNPIRGARRPAALEKVTRIDVVEHLDDGVAELLPNPAALGQPRLIGAMRPSRSRG